MQKRNKKGFTLVELVIVVAVIGVLSAILIPTFINLTNKANEASDQSLVKNLNTVLAVKEESPNYKKVNTPSEMFALLDDEGYNGEKLIKKHKSEKKIIYNLEKNRFLFEENKSSSDNPDDLWEFKDNVTFDTDNGYSIYLFEEYSTAGEVTATAGLDVGQNDEITKVTYDRHDATSGRNAVIRTNGGDVEVNAPKDTVKHYNSANIVNVQAVDPDHSYHEFGSANVAKIANGRLVVTEDAKLGEIRAIATNDAFNNIKVAVVGDATLPKVTRDSVAIESTTEDGTHSQLVLEVQTLDNEGKQQDDSQYVWISVVVESGTAAPASTEVASSKEELSEQTKIPAEQQTPAAASAKQAVKIKKVGTFVELNSALVAKEPYIVLSADIAYPSNGSGLLNINSSTTIDGDGHTLSGYGTRNGNPTTIAINASGASLSDVYFKNLTITSTHRAARPIEARGSIKSLTLDNCNINVTYKTGSGNAQGITLGGNQSTQAPLNINNSTINVGISGYAVITFNPTDCVVTNSTLEGYAAFYFKSPASSAGSHGSDVKVYDSTFNCTNNHNGNSDNFGAIVFEDKDINVSLNDTTINVLELGTATQYAIVFSNDWANYFGVELENIPVQFHGNCNVNGRLSLGEQIEHNTLVVICGGTYTWDPSDYVPEGYLVKQDGNSYIVIKAN